MGKKQSNVEKKEIRHINAKIPQSYSDTIDKLIADKALPSIGQAIVFMMDEREQLLKGINIRKEEICQYRFGVFCTNEPLPQKKLRKTTDEYCKACLQAQKNKSLQDEGADAQQELFDICHVAIKDRVDPFYKWACISEFIDNLNLEIEELKKPVQSYLEEIANVEAELSELREIKRQLESENKNILAMEQQKRVALENDNIHLREQLEKLKHEPIYEKSAWLTQEVRAANDKIAKLEAQIQQQNALTNSFGTQGITTR